MTGGWLGFIIVGLLAGLLAGAILISEFNQPVWVGFVVLLLIMAIAICGGLWYYNSTASGRRALVDEKSNLAQGLERTIVVYTADGHELARYEGRIDIAAEKDYVKFDFDGKRYIYYNCFVETIAELPR